MSEADSTMKVGGLRPAAYNPRKISREQLRMLAKSMAEFGDLGGIIVNRRTGNLIGGHQRTAVFDKSWPIVVTAKYSEPNSVGTVAEGYVDSPWGRWNYREVDFDPRKEAMANIRANKPGGEFDFPKLKDMLVQLDDGGTDLELTGFDTLELKELIDWQAPAGAGDGEGAGLAGKAVKCPKCGEKFTA